MEYSIARAAAVRPKCSFNDACVPQTRLHKLLLTPPSCGCVRHLDHASLAATEFYRQCYHTTDGGL
jgi:hypothetical protein